MKQEFRIISLNRTRFIQLDLLSQSGCVHGFGTVDTGSEAAGARARIQAAFPELAELATVRQVHGTKAVKVGEVSEVPALRRARADILITDRPGIALAARTADCAPLLIFDPRRRVVAAVHSGWRGTVARAGAEAVRVLAEDYGSRIQDLVAGIGPGIMPCHYQVDAPVIAGLREALGRRSRKVLAPDGPDKARLDLSLTNRLILEQAGVPARQIAEVRLCTFCHPDLFFSYRRQGKGVPSLFHFIALV